MNAKVTLSNDELNNLRFSRQYLLCPNEVDVLSDWPKYQISNNLILHAHPNLEVTQVINSERALTLIGYLFDPEKPARSDQDILEEIGQKRTFTEVLHTTFQLAGKFIIIYKDAETFKLFHDSAGLREVFYFEGESNSPCASQPSLIHEYKPLVKAKNSLHQKFYSSSDFDQRKERIGETTQYEDLLHLQPNHFLDLSTGYAYRYFPDESLQPMDLNEAVDQAADLLKGILEAAAERFKLMIAVTAGMDSRLMFAASRNLMPEIFYFILESPALKKSSLDFTTPKKLLSHMKIPFHIIGKGKPVDKEIKDVMLQNVELMHHRHFEFWYNVFYPKKGYMNITSVSEFARNYFHYEADGANLTGEELAALNKFKGNSFVSKIYEQWLSKSNQTFLSNGYNPLDMFYWEEKMGNWLANGRSSMGSVIEDFSPFNCRKLMMIFLGVDEKYRGRYNSVFHKKVIEKLCPEALLEPINGSRKYQLINLLIKLGVYPFYKKLQLLLRS